MRRRAFCLLEVGAILFREGSVLNNGVSDDTITIGPDCRIRGELFTFGHGGRIAFGQKCYLGSGSRVWSGVSVEIGDHVLIAHGVLIVDNLTHPINYLERRRHFEDISMTGHSLAIDLGDKPVRIENDVWIGAHAIILRGVTIGARSIVAAGSVIRRDVPPDSMVAGNPAVVVRELSQ